MPDEIVEEVEEVTEEVVESAEAADETQADELAEEVVDEVVDPPKPKKTAQERINEVTRLRREAEREAEYWKNKALEKDEPKPIPTQPTGRPTIDQYETTEQYEDALFEWRDSVKQAEINATNQEKEEAEQLRVFNQRAAELRKNYADFDEVIESEVFTPNMRLAILNSDKGPQLAYHLGLPENRDLAEKIRDLPTHMQSYEIGKLDSRLSIAKKTKTVTNAPNPIKPVGISGGGEEDPSKMTTAEWMAWDQARQVEKAKQKLGEL